MPRLLRTAARRTAAAARLVRAAAPALALAVAGLTVACADGPTSPAAPAQAAFTPGPHRELSIAPTVSLQALTRTAPLANDIVVTTTVNPGGGNIVNIPEADVHINFPAKFVQKPTTFTIVARKGSAVAYDFYPAGTFTSAVQVTQRLGNTTWAGGAPSSLEGAYVHDWAQLDAVTNTATSNEVLPTTFDRKANAVVLNVFHFSGYLISTGRK